MPRKIQVIFGLDPDKYEILEKAAKKKEKSKSEIIRKALEQYLKSREDGK